MDKNCITLIFSQVSPPLTPLDSKELYNLIMYGRYFEGHS